MSTTTLINKQGDEPVRTNYDSTESGLVALILDADGSFLAVNDPENLQPLLYRKSKGSIDIVNLHEAPASLNLALFTNPEMKEAVLKSPVLESTTAGYRALKAAFEEIENIIEHYSYAKYWLAH